MASAPLPAQTTDDSDSETPPPPGATTINSDELHSDQQTHISVFTGNVVVLGPGTIPKTSSGKLRRANSVTLVT